jgi:hypothetical protein
MKLKVFIVTFLAAVGLIGCSGESTTQVDHEDINIKELVHEYSVGIKTAPRASITSQQLIVTDKEGNELMYDLPEKEFFVSIAPYVNETHP